MRSGLADQPAHIPRPSHAYLPGVNARHPEDWFDDIKISVGPQTPLDALHLTLAWQAGLEYFEAGYYWECHEVLEAVWLQTPEWSAERDMAQAMIQLANARIKIRMQRLNAARRLCDMVLAHLARCPMGLPVLGLERPMMERLVQETLILIDQ
jgi:uncharacterized protein